MKKRLLIVDDERLSAVFLRKLLEGYGYDVSVAESYSEAVEAALQTPPDVLITDWMLRETFTGLDVAQELRKTSPQLSLIFVTGLAPEMLTSQLKDMDRYHVLEKPVEVEELLTMLNT